MEKNSELWLKHYGPEAMERKSREFAERLTSAKVNRRKTASDLDVCACGKVGCDCEGGR